MRSYATHIKTRLRIYAVYLLLVPFFLLGMMFLTGKAFQENHETIARLLAMTVSFYVAAIIGAFSFKVVKSIKGFAMFSLMFLILLLIIGKLSEWFVLNSDIGLGKGISNWNFMVMGPILIIYSMLCAIITFELAWAVAAITTHKSAKDIKPVAQ